MAINTRDVNVLEFNRSMDNQIAETKALTLRIYKRALEMLVEEMQARCPYATGYLHSTFRIAISGAGGGISQDFQLMFPRYNYHQRLVNGDLSTGAYGGEGGYGRTDETGTVITGSRGSPRPTSSRQQGQFRQTDRLGRTRRVPRRRRGFGSQWGAPIERMRFGDTVLMVYLAVYANRIHWEHDPWMLEAMQMWPQFVNMAANEVDWSKVRATGSGPRSIQNVIGGWM